MDDRVVLVDGRSVMVRDAGDPHGSPVVHFHGTPSSRLAVSFGEETAARMGVRVISFDRPGYGGSELAPYTLSSIGKDAGVIADSLGLGRFATFGWSGGGPFALAAAAVLGDRVTTVGAAGGAGPYREIPGSLHDMSEAEAEAVSFLPDDPSRAAEAMAAAQQEITSWMRSDLDNEKAPWIDWMWGESDPDLVTDPVVRRSLFLSHREAMRQGAMGMAWDAVNLVGSWDIDLSDVRCPVHLWYGALDKMAPLVHGEWLRDHLPHAELVVYAGEGHLIPMRRWPEILETLTQESSDVTGAAQRSPAR